MPASAMQRSTPAASRSILTPSASSTSAEPQWLEAARFPCLATGTPAPATTIAATVEMLNVPLRSPPVPTTSTTGDGGRTGFANSSIVRARPSTSSTVSPFVRSAISSPPIWAAVASPAMTVRMASAASSALRASRAEQAKQDLGPEVGVGLHGAGTLAGRTRRGAARYTCDPRRLRSGGHAGVVQWQNVSFPSSRRGFDSPHPLRADLSDER